MCFRSLAVGTKTGYRLYSLSSVDNLDQIYENGKIHYKLLKSYEFSVLRIQLL